MHVLISVIDESVHVAVRLQGLEMSSITKLNKTILNVCKGTYLGKNWRFYRSAIMKKNSTVIMCKWNRFGFWNSCKSLQNFVNLEALVISRQKNVSASKGRVKNE